MCRASEKEGCKRRRELDQRIWIFCGGEHFHSLSSAVTVSCLSPRTLCPPAPEIYSRSGHCEINILRHHRHHSGCPSVASPCSEKSQISCPRLSMVCPWLPPQPQPISPSNRTGLSNHHESACFLSSKGHLAPLPETFFLPLFPTLLLAHPSGKKKKKAASRNVLTEAGRSKILEKEGVTDGE